MGTKAMCGLNPAVRTKAGVPLGLWSNRGLTGQLRPCCWFVSAGVPHDALISAAKLSWKVRLESRACLLSVSPWPSIPSQSRGKSTLRARMV